MERVQILWVGRIYKSVNDGVKAHFHHFYHMLVVQSGQQQMTAGEEQYMIGAGSAFWFRER